MSDLNMTADAVTAARTLSFRTLILNRDKFLGQRRHDLRIGKQPGYVVEEKSVNNTLLFIQPGYGPDFAKQKLTRAVDSDERQMDLRRKNKTRARNLWRMALLTFSEGAQVSLGNIHPDDEAVKVMQDFADRHQVRLLLVVAHRDETAIHYHSLYENISLAGSALCLNASQLSAEQDISASHFAHLGISRGVLKVKRVADAEPVHKTINRSVRQLHRDLPLELEAKKAEVLSAHERLVELEAKADEHEMRQQEIDSVAIKVNEQAQELVAFFNKLKADSMMIDEKKAALLAEAQRLAKITNQLDDWREELALAEIRLAREADYLGELRAGRDHLLRP